MGSVIVDVELRAKNEVSIKALVDTGFYGDFMMSPEMAEKAGVELRHERMRKLPDGRAVKVRYGGGEVGLMEQTTYGDVEVWEDIDLPEGIGALLGVTALEKLGFKVDPRTGKLERIELYLL